VQQTPLAPAVPSCISSLQFVVLVLFPAKIRQFVSLILMFSPQDYMLFCTLEGNPVIASIIRILGITKIYPWSIESDLGKLLHSFQFNKQRSMPDLVKSFQKQLGFQHVDIQQIFRKVLEKTRDKDFLFGEFQRTRHCIDCSLYEHQKIPSALVHFMTIDSKSLIEANTQQLVDASLHTRKEFECQCDPTKRMPIQYETIRYSRYPNVLVLLPDGEGKAIMQIDMELTMPDGRKYVLAGYITSHGADYIAVGRVNGMFYDLTRPGNRVNPDDLIIRFSSEVRVILYEGR